MCMLYVCVLYVYVVCVWVCVYVCVGVCVMITVVLLGSSGGGTQYIHSTVGLFPGKYKEVSVFRLNLTIDFSSVGFIY